jgi:hypothetical protein
MSEEDKETFPFQVFENKLTAPPVFSHRKMAQD